MAQNDTAQRLNLLQATHSVKRSGGQADPNARRGQLYIPNEIKIETILSDNKGIYEELIKAENHEAGSGWGEFNNYLNNLKKIGYPVPENREKIKLAYKIAAIVQDKPRRYTKNSTMQHSAGVAFVGMAATQNYGQFRKSLNNPAAITSEELFEEVAIATLLHDVPEDYGAYWLRVINFLFDNNVGDLVCAMTDELRENQDKNQKNLLKLQTVLENDEFAFEIHQKVQSRGKVSPGKSPWYKRKKLILDRIPTRTPILAIVEGADHYMNSEDGRKEHTHFNGKNPENNGSYWVEYKFGGGAQGSGWYLGKASQRLTKRYRHLDPNRNFSGLGQLCDLLAKSTQDLHRVIRQDFPDMKFDNAPQWAVDEANPTGLRP